ncbi:hypothetical protein ACFLIP_03095 [Enterobacter hormaechei]
MRISSRSTPFERIEYVLILSVLMLLVIVTLQPILTWWRYLSPARQTCPA